ncbi:hypothetical protein ACOBQX_13010 [Actinokineospora sp. G85]|uniref:hypothetical protein n=1 Tax=Actinokineospora sp. G85 TaxID=3406626 RepID=UPI003C7906C1
MSRTFAPRGLLLVALLCAVVAVGALVGAAALRDRGPDPVGQPPAPAPPAPGVGQDGCRPGEACQQLGRATAGSTYLDLIGDPGGASGRVRIGGPTTSEIIEVTVVGSGVVLGPDSLVCGGDAFFTACLVRGTGPDGVAGQVISGRSGKWSAGTVAFHSDAGLLTLGNTDADSAPEVLAATRVGQGGHRVRLVVHDVVGGDPVGCTREYPGVRSLPGYPAVSVTKAALRPCA